MAASMEGVEFLARSRQVIAHRGASAVAPEHTHEAYGLAVAQGAHVLELDVRATADGELVVVHDPTLTRTIGDARRVDTLTRAALAGLVPSTRPLTLDAVLERYSAALRLLVELKDPEPDWEGLVIEAVERHVADERVALQSFDVCALRRLRMRAPRLARWHRFTVAGPLRGCSTRSRAAPGASASGTTRSTPGSSRPHMPAACSCTHGRSTRRRP